VGENSVKLVVIAIMKIATIRDVIFEILEQDNLDCIYIHFDFNVGNLK